MTARRKRPVVLHPLSRLTGRDAVWACVRDLGSGERPFTATEIDRRITAGPDLVRDYLRRLVAAGILDVVPPPGRGTAAVYRLVRDCGVEPPRVTASGEIEALPTDQERLWQAMKALPAFDARDLQLSTGIAKEQTVRSYIRHLLRAGYLAEVAQERRGRGGHLARYRLLMSRNTGPRPPAIRRGHVVFDLNLGRQVWPEVQA